MRFPASSSRSASSSGRRWGTRAPPVPPGRSLDTAVTAFDGAGGPAEALRRLAGVRDRAHALAAAVSDAAAYVAGQRKLDYRPAPPPRPGRAALRAQMTLQSTMLRHALRLRAAAAAGLLFAQAPDPAHRARAATAALILPTPDAGPTPRNAHPPGGGT